jgi:hypothetical protein
VAEVDAVLRNPKVSGWPVVEQRVTSDPAVALGDEVDETAVGPGVAPLLEALLLAERGRAGEAAAETPKVRRNQGPRNSGLAGANTKCLVRPASTQARAAFA